MSYQRVSAHDAEDEASPTSPTTRPISSSPPPSFHSRASSAAPHERQRLVSADANRTLADTFDSPSDDEDDDGPSPHPQLDDRQRAMSGRPANLEQLAPTSDTGGDRPRPVERRVTQLPIFAPATSARVYGGGNSVHDGVFANLSAKPGPGEETEEKPPSYEQAAADATPPYWETSILAPGATSSDEVFIDGLPVGSLFSFVWNGMISMSFQLVGFLLTYLLHTTHAAKNGSKAGLGVTLIQYGFGLKSGLGSDPGTPVPGQEGPDNGGVVTAPGDPNGHEFDPNAPAETSGQFINGAPGNSMGPMKTSDWFAYALMIVGWFLLIRSLSEYLRARRHEQLVLQSPSRGLSTPVVAEDERPEQSV